MRAAVMATLQGSKPHQLELPLLSRYEDAAAAETFVSLARPVVSRSSSSLGLTDVSH